MTSPRTERHLAAVLTADVVGYCRLMSLDEAGTLTRLKTHRKEFIEPAITGHHGRIVKLMGDGALVEFSSVVDAVDCAVAIQKGMAERNAGAPDDERIQFRIGINLGDVIVEGDDIYGDGVNIAARLQALAEPGGICVTRTVRNHVKGKLALAFTSMGEHQVKNIAEPIGVYSVEIRAGTASRPRRRQRAPGRSRWALAGAAASFVIVAGVGYALLNGEALFRLTGFRTALVSPAVSETVLPLPDKPSIAVLPFTNVGGEPRWDRLADGITEDIITDLARRPYLFVIGGNSSFKYKNQPVDVRQVGHDLGVRFVLEGSIQAENGRVRVTAQVIEADTGGNVWADRYDRADADIFAVQDEVAEKVDGALASYSGAIAKADLTIAKSKPPANLQAYDYYLIGVEYKHRLTKDDNAKAIELLNKAVEVDPKFARAWGTLAVAYWLDLINSWTPDVDKTVTVWKRAINTALELDPNEPWGLHQLGALRAREGDFAAATEAYDRAMAIAPNDADLVLKCAWASAQNTGRLKEGLDLARKAVRLNPNYPQWYLIGFGVAAYYGGAYEEAAKALAGAPKTTEVRLFLAMSLAMLGRDAEAAKAVAELRKAAPTFSPREYGTRIHPAAQPLFEAGIKKAGLYDAV